MRIIEGNAGQDFQLRTTRNGDFFATGSVAVNHQRRNEDNTYSNVGTTWVQVVVFGTHAAQAGNIAKGQRVIVGGEERINPVTKNGTTYQNEHIQVTNRSGFIARSMRFAPKGEQTQDVVVSTVEDFDGGQAELVAAEEVEKPF